MAQYLDYGIRTGLSSDKRAEYMEKMEASEGCNPSGSGKTDSLSAPSRIERRSSVQNMVDRILSIFGANSQKC